MENETEKTKPISLELIGAMAGTFTLSVLAHGDSYGYEIVQKIKKLAKKPVTWREAGIYPILKRYQKKEYIESYWEIKSGQRPRNYYKITDKGLHALQESKKDFEAITDICEQLWK